MSAQLLQPGDAQVLGYLLRSPEGVDVNLLRHDLGVTPPEVEARVGRLRGFGCKIEQADATHFRLVRTGLAVWQEYLEFALSEAGTPRRVVVYRSVASTQDAARDAAASDGVVLADEQTAGRGRRGRRWVAPPGAAILFSMTHAFGPAAAESVDGVQCLAAVAAAQVIEKLTRRAIIPIKWPNDLVVDDRKLAGVLVETFATPRGRVCVIGVGINAEPFDETAASFPPELRGRTINLRELGCIYDRLHVAAEMIAQVDRHLRSPAVQPLLDEWRVRNLLRSRQTRFLSDGKTIAGEVIDLDADAGLIVRTDGGQVVHLHTATTTIL